MNDEADKAAVSVFFCGAVFGFLLCLLIFWGGGALLASARRQYTECMSNHAPQTMCLKYLLPPEKTP
mgnify:CR=1 FL=1